MIQVKNLRFTYAGNLEETLHNIDFEVKEGEIFGFLGPSGAGKSTTQKVLTGILKNYTGSVQVFDKEIKQQGRGFYERVGISFEFPNVYTKLTARENLEYFASMYSGKTADPMELLSMVGLEQSADTQVSKFSKGMKMRLNFCRAFLNHPDLIFLDEPTTGLDPSNARKIKDIILERKKQGKTVFLTTHNMNVAEELCDRVAFMVEGKLPLIDSPRELMVSRGKRAVRVEFEENSHAGKKDFPLDGIGDNREFLGILRDGKIKTIHSLEATLEDIFIETTGQSLSVRSEL